MKRIQFLQAANTISRYKQRLQQDLAFTMLVENVAYDKQVEVHWAGEDRVWHMLPAKHRASVGPNQELWSAQAGVVATETKSLPGDIEFALRYQVHGLDFWDNNEARNYCSNADSGVLLHHDLPLLNVDYTPHLSVGQRHYPITVAVRQIIHPSRVWICWTTDNWRTTQESPCFFHRMYWEKWSRSNARNPNRYDTSVWTGQIKVDDAFRVEYAIGCETPNGIIWDNNFGRNYVARRRRLKILTLNLHCYQEDNQDAKFSQIARAINDLDIDIVCLQEVGEPLRNGGSDWNANAAKIIRERLRDYYHLHTDWSHIGFDRFREGVAVLSRFNFLMTDAGYVSSSHDVHTVNSRKVVMVQVNVPYMGLVNIFSCHLSWPQGGFFDQFDRLRAWANSKHGGNVVATFLCGDFNIKAGSDGYRAVVFSGDYEDQYLSVTSHEVFDNVFRHHAQNMDQQLGDDWRIDFIFKQKHSRLEAVAAREVFTDGDYYGRVSDHTGYFVEFEPQ